MNRKEILSQIVAQPNEDEFRLLFSESCKADDPLLSALISTQVLRGKERRKLDESTYVPQRELELISKNSHRWFEPIHELTISLEMDRGFVSFVSVDPYVFMERGDELLRLAPIKHVSLGRPSDGRSFPVVELAQCPFLGHLDTLWLEDLDLEDGDIESIANSSFLTNCLTMELSYNPLGFEGFRALAKSPNTRGLLQTYRNQGTPKDYYPGQRRYQATFEDSWAPPTFEWAPLGKDGQALEREFGYLPWLHPQDNACDKFDARWFVEQGILPKRPAGSPVD